MNGLHPADRTALEKVVAVSPEWSAVGAAGDLIGLPIATFLHAGPLFKWPEPVSPPILNSACVAIVFEGLAANFATARSMIEAGEILFRPGQDYGVVVPLAGVVSSSMKLQVIGDGGVAGARALAPIDTAAANSLRLGVCNESTLAHLIWLNGALADHLAEALVRPIGLSPVFRAAWERDGAEWTRRASASRMLGEQLTDRLREAGRRADGIASVGMHPEFFNNLWMAACKLALMSARGTLGSSVLVAIGTNGKELGIQIADVPGRWFTATLHATDDRRSMNPFPIGRSATIGDGAIVDVLGLGPMAFAYDARVDSGSPFGRAGRALASSERLMPHPDFEGLSLKVGLSARDVIERCSPPPLESAALEHDDSGRRDGGVLAPPLAVFSEALAAITPWA